ncbi:hypothetical protein BDP27DRAFT_1337916 [Rhodocollybia butyracea]|uniref:Uncharacterized protein n=1 Tax=Rhodocollybia butyracea TaxID=206335 RepID=A0A9P5U0N1_9AGAR|nr:hypothetical protein BDP27DRAFT_1337916 [Rhodocollybia butyracea]
MSSSNNNPLSCFLRWCRCLICSSSAVVVDNAEADHMATLVKAFKEGKALDPLYSAILKDAMENPKLRDAFTKAVMDNMKLLSLNPSDYVKAVAQPSFAIERHLTPPYGTRGYSHQIYKGPRGTDWTVNVHAYRHANSDNITLILLHSGYSEYDTTFTLWTNPRQTGSAHYPIRYDSGDRENGYSYHIDYTESINMIGPDGRNPIVFRAQYKETFIAQPMGLPGGPYDGLQFQQAPGRIHGMSVFNASVKLPYTVWIYFRQESYRTGHPDSSVGRIEIKV